jgi:hypothetical protein
MAAAACSSSSNSSTTTTTGGGSSSADLTLLNAAPAKTLAAGTAKAAATFDATSGKNAIGGTLAGDFNLTSGYGSLTLTGSGLLATLLAGPTAIQFVGGTLYLKPNPGTTPASLLGPGQIWAAINLASAATLEHVDLGPLGTALEGNPVNFLKVFETPDETVTTVGSSTVDGQPATEYAVTVDLTKAGASGPNRLFYDALAQAGSGTSTSDVWIGTSGPADGLIVQVKATMTVSAPPATAGATTAAGASAPAPTTIPITLDLSDFGLTVPVLTAPPAATVNETLNSK